MAYLVGFGCYAGQLASGVIRQGPNLSVVGQLQTAFQRFAQDNTRLALLDCLTAACCSNSNSRWPVGHFVVFRESSQYMIYYLGAVQPKVILLVLEDQYGHPQYLDDRCYCIQHSSVRRTVCPENFGYC